MNKNLLLLKMQAQIWALQAESKGWENGDPDWVNRGKDGRFAKSDSVNQFELTVEPVKIKIQARLDRFAALMEASNDDVKIKIQEMVNSPSSKDGRAWIGQELRKINPDAADAYDLAVSKLEKSFIQEPLDDATKGAFDAAVKTAKKGSFLTAPAAVALGVAVAAAVTGGAAGLAIAAGAGLAINQFTIPNWQGRGGEHRGEVFLHEEENRKNVIGYLKEYIKGATSNALFTAGLHTAALATVVLLAEVYFGTLEEDKKAFFNAVNDATKGEFPIVEDAISTVDGKMKKVEQGVQKVKQGVDKVTKVVDFLT